MSEPLRIAWFAPNAGNWVTHRIEHRVANALADAGHSITMVQCDRVLDAYCQVMAPAGLDALATASTKHAVCRECIHAAGLTRADARYSTRQLSEYLDGDDLRQVREAVERVRPDTWSGIEVDGVPIGRYAAYTTMLHHKRPTVSDTELTWAEYRADLRNALLLARATPRIMAEVQPTNAVVYNALYPANRVFAEVMLRRGVPVSNLSAGPSVPRRYATLAVYDGIRASQTTTDSAAFAASLTVPCSMQEVMQVERHIGQLISGTDPWVYSAAPRGHAPAQLRTALGVRPESPVAVVLVNSPDETRSAQLVDAEYFRAREYSDVAEYLDACVATARLRPEVDFVIRLHPRLAPNKREKVTSPDLEHLYRALADLPPNAVVNHPSDGMSLYELVAISDAAINQSSSAGLEFLAFGIPVLQYDAPRLGAYPAAFTIQAPRHDPQAFASALDAALAEGFDLRHVIDAYRWYASLHIRSVVHLEPLDEIPEAQPDEVAPVESAGRARPRALTRLIPARVRAGIDRRIVRAQRESDPIGGPLDPTTVAELEASLRSASVEGDVWEPSMRLPVASSADEERRTVEAALRRLRVRLPAGPGTGAVDGDPTVRS